MKFSSPRLQRLVLSFPRRDKNILNFIRFRGLYWFCAIFSSVLSFRDINIVKYLNMRSTVTGIYYCTLHMIVYGLLYLCNFHYFQYFVIVRAHRKLVCWLLLGVVWINNLSIYLIFTHFVRPDYFKSGWWLPSNENLTAGVCIVNCSPPEASSFGRSTIICSSPTN